MSLGDTMFNVVKCYRLARWLSLHNVPFIPKVIDYFIRWFFSCWFPHTVQVGRHIVLGYGGLGVVIHSRAVIGDFCHIDQNVTIGGTSKKYEVPVIGDYVYIGAGAVILGPVTIGSNVVIGANAVVVKDIPDGCVVAGVPARILKRGIFMKDYV